LPAGRVADAIVNAATERGCDIIVMGSHGRRGVKRMLLGSDAELVLRMSRMPVLIVPSHEE
jgi:nucleotide-binding universal stress UspA family protein